MERLLTIFSLVLVISFSTYGQRKYDSYNMMAEGFELHYQSIDARQMVPGPSGTGRIWDFTDLKPIGDPVVRIIVKPDSLTKAEFPNANYMEVYNDGSFSALREEYGRTYRMGFYDTIAKIKITYHLPMLLQRFPMSYKDVVSKSYTSFFEMGDHRFSSEGKVKLEADGYGNLLLPDTSYTSVMRVRLVRDQTDFIEKYETTQKSTVTTYMWFDESNKYPIMILQKSSSGEEEIKEAQYLIRSKRKGKNRRKYQFREY